MRVRDALDELATSALRRVAASHGLAVDDATTRAELVERIADRLSDPIYVTELISSLADDERAALRAARASGGEIRGPLLDRDQPGAATPLVERGLLFRTFAAAGPRRGEVFSLPEEILAVLPAPPPAEQPPSEEQPPAQRRSSDPAFSMFALASTMHRPSADLEAETQDWSEEPGGWDRTARWAFLRHLGKAAGLSTADGQVATRLPRLLNDPPAFAERLQRAYVHDRGWSELAVIGIEQAAELVEPSLVRGALVEAVQTLPEGGWTSFQVFSEWLRRTRPNFLREQLDARGLLLLESRPWAELELPLVRYVVLGPMYWLGVIASSVDGEFIARRPVTRGRAGEPCTWHAPAELVAPTRADLGTLFEAERYLILEERGRPSRYRLVQQHVGAALGQGGSIEECRKLLRRLTQAALPASVEERLTAWSERFGALTLRPAVVLDARDAAELDEAVAEESVRPFVHRRLGPATAEVAAADVLELAAALRATGHLPRVDAALRLTAEPWPASSGRSSTGGASSRAASSGGSSSGSSSSGGSSAGRSAPGSSASGRSSSARSGPGRSYPGLVDEHVLEFLLVSLLAFRQARPERLAELEGALSLLERLEHQFSRERLRELRTNAERLAGELRASPPPASSSKSSRARRRAAPRRPVRPPL